MVLVRCGDDESCTSYVSSILTFEFLRLQPERLFFLICILFLTSLLVVLYKSYLVVLFIRVCRW